MIKIIHTIGTLKLSIKAPELIIPEEMKHRFIIFKFKSEESNVNNTLQN